MSARHALPMISLQATNGPTSSSPLKAEEMMARIKGRFDSPDHQPPSGGWGIRRRRRLVVGGGRGLATVTLEPVDLLA